MKTIATYKAPGQYSVRWEQNSAGIHSVTYGAEVFQTEDNIEAAEKFGVFINHAATCAGLIKESPNEPS